MPHARRLVPWFGLAAVVALAACGGDAARGAGGAPDAGHDAPGSPADAGELASDGSSEAATGADAGSARDGMTGGQDSGQGSHSDAASDASMGSVGPYGSDGSHAVTTVTFQVPSPNGTFTTTAYIPSGSGPAPVVILSSGFFQNGVAYAPYASRLASWGVVTFLRDDPNVGETTPNVASDVGYMVTTWLGATSADGSSKLAGRVDLTKIGLAGHSRGGQVALLAAEGAAKGHVQGVFGLDPVDTSMSGSPQARTTLATVGVPVAFIGETTDSAPSSCAPATDNFQVLFMAAASPAVAITSVGADHTMYEDPASCTLCTVCTAGTASAAQVLATAVRYLMAFFARQLLGDTTVGASFAGAGANQDLAAGLIQLTSK